MSTSTSVSRKTQHPVHRDSTVYIAPGDRQCRVYVLPYHMRPGQVPSDIHHRYHAEWREIGLLNSRLELVCIEPDYAHLKDDIAGQMGGSFFPLVNGLPV